MVAHETHIGKDLEVAADLLARGQLVAIPTETVYGLAGNALNADAVRSIFAAKGRPQSNPLIVHTHSIAAIEDFVLDLPPLALQLLEAFSPGPLTLLLPKKKGISDAVTAGSPLTAVRIPNHPLTLELLRRLDFPLVAPSANRFMSISPTTAEHVLQQLDGRIPYILDGGPCSTGIESTVIGFEQDAIRIYRQGAITEEMLQSFAPVIAASSPGTDALLHSPGMLSHHYAPRTPLIWTSDVQYVASGFPVEKTGLLLFSDKLPGFPEYNQIVLSPSGNLEEAARGLYEALYQLDAKKLDVIIAQPMPDEGLGRAINDRLRRASQS